MPEIELAGGPWDGNRIQAPDDRAPVSLSLFEPDGKPGPPLVYAWAGTCDDGTHLYRLRH